MVKTTRAQREALFRKWIQMRTPEGVRERRTYPTYRQFRRTVQPYFDGSGCVMVQWCGMWLGIETDGYTHS